MATFAKVRPLSSALALTFVLALSLAGAGAAHAAPRATTKDAVPQTCGWYVQYYNTGNIYESPGGLYVGIYQVYVLGDSCDTSLHEGKGEMFFNEPTAGCFTGTWYNIELYVGGKPYVHSGTVAENQIGSPGICFDDRLSAITSTYTSAAQNIYCAVMEGSSGYDTYTFPNIDAGNDCPS